MIIHNIMSSLLCGWFRLVCVTQCERQMQRAIAFVGALNPAMWFMRDRLSACRRRPFIIGMFEWSKNLQALQSCLFLLSFATILELRRTSSLYRFAIRGLWHSFKR